MQFKTPSTILGITILPSKLYLFTASGYLYDTENPHNNFNSLSFNFLINLSSIITANYYYLLQLMLVMQRLGLKCL